MGLASRIGSCSSGAGVLCWFRTYISLKYFEHFRGEYLLEKLCWVWDRTGATQLTDLEKSTQRSRLLWGSRYSGKKPEKS